MKIYSYPSKAENNVVMMATGCIVLNGHEIGQWKKDEFGYSGFLFNNPSRVFGANTKHNLIHSRGMIFWISESIHYNK